MSLKDLFKDAGIPEDKLDEIVEAIGEYTDSIVATKYQEILTRVSELQTSNNKLTEKLVEMKELSESKVENANSAMVETISQLNYQVEMLQDQINKFDDERQDIIQFTMQEAQEHFDNIISETLIRVAEDYIKQNDQELSIVAESTLDKIVSKSIYESLESTGITIHTDSQDLLDKINQLEESLSVANRKNKLYQEAINEIQKEMIIEEHSKGMSELEAKRFRKVAEGITFHDKDSYATGLSYIQESVKPKSKTYRSGNELMFTQEDDTSTPSDDVVDRVLALMRR